MAYTIDNDTLVDGPLTQVDDSARYPLGFTVTDKNGKEYVYVKATAALTAGTAVAGVARSALTVTASSAFEGGFLASASTPSLSTTSFNGNELKGTLVKITRSATAIGLFPITEAEYNGTNYVCQCPEVKAGDTVVFANGAQVVAAGGVSSTEGGATNVTPLADIPAGSFAFVVPETVGDGTGSESGAHNSFRGRDLTSLYTLDELSAKVQAGDFSDIFVGDYITKKVKVGSDSERNEDFVVAAIDYWYGVGDQGNGLRTHHLLMIPKDGFHPTMKMNGTDTTTGGYYGSAAHGIASPAYTAGSGGALTKVVADYETFLHTTLGANDGTYTFTHNGTKWKYGSQDAGTNLGAYGVTYSGTPVAGDKIVLTFAKGNLEPFRKAIYDAFGESHILTHRTYMTTSNSAGQWHNARVELMNECMVFGSKIYANNSEGERAAPIQLPYFQMEPQMRIAHRDNGGPRSYAWLSSIGSGSNFCGVSYNGDPNNYTASYDGVVRPYFLFA